MMMMMMIPPILANMLFIPSPVHIIHCFMKKFDKQREREKKKDSKSFSIETLLMNFSLHDHHHHPPETIQSIIIRFKNKNHKLIIIENIKYTVRQTK